MKVYVLTGETDYSPSIVLGVRPTLEDAQALAKAECDSEDTRLDREQRHEWRAAKYDRRWIMTQMDLGSPCPRCTYDGFEITEFDIPERADDADRVAKKEQVLRVLTENGLTGAGDLHGWRCGHPDRYGPCNCVDELAEDLMTLFEKEET